MSPLTIKLTAEPIPVPPESAGSGLVFAVQHDERERQLHEARGAVSEREDGTGVETRRSV